MHGLTDGVIGPTLLDLKDVLETSVGEISFILMMSSFGALLGNFSIGFLLDKHQKYQYLLMAGTVKSIVGVGQLHIYYKTFRNPACSMSIFHALSLL